VSKLHVKHKEIAVPGDLLAEGMDFVPSTGSYRDSEKVFASRVGIIDIRGSVIKVIPLNGRYMPKKNDVVIGKVVDIGYNYWSVDIGGPASAHLSVSEGVSDYVDLARTDLSRYYDFDDYVVAKVLRVGRDGFVQLTTKGPGLRKLRGGKLMKMTPTKVPRAIGKAGSMINMLKDMTRTEILVGQNGCVWIKGDPENELQAGLAISRIDEESHKAGLTGRIEEMLNNKKGVKNVQKKV
jgi:exosome complex component RRP4